MKKPDWGFEIGNPIPLEQPQERRIPQMGAEMTRKNEAPSDLGIFPAFGAYDPDGMALKAETGPDLPDLWQSLEELEPAEARVESGLAGSIHGMAANPLPDRPSGREMLSDSHGIGKDSCDSGLTRHGKSNSAPPEKTKEEAGAASAGSLFWDEAEDFQDDFLPLEDLPLRSEPGSADGEGESQAGGEAQFGGMGQVEADAQGRHEAQVEAEDSTGVDTFEDAFEEPEPFILEEPEASAEIETIKDARDLISESSELLREPLSEAVDPFEVTAGIAIEEQVPSGIQEDAPPVAGMVEESEPVTGSSEAVEVAEPELEVLEVLCPACKKALSLRREFLGIEGACVWCQTPIVAAACGLNGEVRIFRIAVELPGPA